MGVMKKGWERREGIGMEEGDYGVGSREEAQ